LPPIQWSALLEDADQSRMVLRLIRERRKLLIDFS